MSAIARLVVFGCMVLVAAFGCLSPAAAQWAPTQPIRVIIPYAAGGTSDIVARVMSEPLRERLGQQLVLENRGGGATQIGTSLVAKSKPDGHTILLVANTFTINPSLFSKLPYDSLNDLAPITYAGVTPHTIVVNNALPATTLKELLDLARKRPGELSYGSVGNGTSFHLGTEELKKLSGTSMIHVPYKGMGQVLTDVIAGNIQLAFANTPNAAPLVREGKLRAVAVAHPTRVHQLPEVPTVAEQGFPGFSSNSAFMYLAPGGTPPEILDRLNAEFVAVLKLPAVREVLTKQGVEVMGMTRAETADFIRSEMQKYAEVVKFSGAKVD
jgi:tripartite-type tricarboxylate transporter receptor subunit TctC